MYGQISGDRDFDGILVTQTGKKHTWRSSRTSPRLTCRTHQASNPVTAIRDPFGNSYGYSTMKASGGANGYNPTFDLWSITDGRAEPDQTKWIKNW